MSNPVVIVTGASRGIGLATVHHLLSQKRTPVRVLAIARSSDALQSLSSSSPDPSRIETLTGDLCHDYTSVCRKAVQICKSKWGRIDGLVLNHGTLDPIAKVADAKVSASSSSGKEGESNWEDHFKTSFFSCVEFVKVCLEDLRESKGRIVMVSSGAASNRYYGWGAYGAAKAAMNHLATTLAAEEPDVTTIAFRPGSVDTAMQTAIREKHQAGMSEKEYGNFVTMKETGKLLKPEDVGTVIGNLALKASKEFSGKFVNIAEDAMDPYRAKEME